MFEAPAKTKNKGATGEPSPAEALFGGGADDKDGKGAEKRLLKDLDSELAKGKPKKPAAPWKKPRLDEIGADDEARPGAGFQAEEGGLGQDSAAELEPSSGPTGFYCKEAK